MVGQVGRGVGANGEHGVAHYLRLDLGPSDTSVVRIRAPVAARTSL